MTLAMFISIRCGTKPGEKQRNSILLLTLAPRFICGTKMKFDQMNLEVLFTAIAIRGEVIRTQSSSIPLGSSLDLFLQATISSTVGQKFMKTHPFGESMLGPVRRLQRDSDLHDTGAMLYQLSYEASLEAGQVRVQFIPVMLRE